MDHRAEEFRTVVLALSTVWRTDRVSIWSVTSGQNTLAFGQVMHGDDLAVAGRTWAHWGPTLKAGEVVRRPGAVWYPLRTPEGLLVGFVQAIDPDESKRPFIRETVVTILCTLAELIVTPAESPLEEAAEDEGAGHVGAAEALAALLRPSRTVQRARLCAVLDAAEWNYSQAARVLGVTRQTIWRRVRVLKLSRPRPAVTDPRPRRTRD